MSKRAGDIDRTTYIGGSDIAAILGVSPWKTPLQLYYEKIGEAAEELDAERLLFFKRRKRMEPVVAEILRDDKGYDLVRLSTDGEPNRYRDPNGIFAAEIDFEWRMNDYARRDFPVLADIPNGTLLNGEIKTVHPLAARDFGEDGSDEIPVYYTSQKLWGLGILPERPAGLLVAMIGFDDIRCYPILRDDETIQWMRDEALRFRNEHIIPRIPPPPTTLDDAKRLFARFNGRPVELDDDAFDALQRIANARSMAKAAKDAKDEAEKDLALAIARAWMLDEGPDSTADNAVLRRDGQDVGTWKLTRGSFLDQKRLAKEHEEIIDQYTVGYTYRKVMLKKRK